MSFDTQKEENISKTSSKMDHSGMKVDLEVDVECYFDKFSYSAVWVDPNVNMHVINEFLEQINIYDTNEFGDQTPSNILELLSSLFPSGFGEGSPPAVSEQVDFISSPKFVHSTPHQKWSSAKRKKEKLARQEFSMASPILGSPIAKPDNSVKVLTKKKLDMSFDP